jgi:smad nuclear-interacting protein 1
MLPFLDSNGVSMCSRGTNSKASAVLWRRWVFLSPRCFADEPLHVHRQSVFLFGKDPSVADILTAHPTCSRQHAVLQYRMVEAAGKRVVRPYVMDLQSTNGTFLNGTKIDDSRYVELRPGDTLRFGESSREYVLLHDAMAST